jgi:D-inositol-3-phosphate glycosyltransferase
MRKDLVVAICGGPSGSGLDEPDALHRLAAELGISDVVRFVPPINRQNLVTWFQAADLCAVPSHSESFGLVALEAQACGTPVVATRVGGLTTTVAAGSSGLLVNGHDPTDWAQAISQVLGDKDLAATLQQGAISHAAKFGWDRTTDELLEVYQHAVSGN